FEELNSPPDAKDKSMTSMMKPTKTLESSKQIDRLDSNPSKLDSTKNGHTEGIRGLVYKENCGYFCMKKP
ncbi:hypothetical protein TorRG33x02_211700, partial [Trema orientale]